MQLTTPRLVGFQHIRRAGVRLQPWSLAAPERDLFDAPKDRRQAAAAALELIDCFE